MYKRDSNRQELIAAIALGVAALALLALGSTRTREFALPFWQVLLFDPDALLANDLVSFPFDR